MQLLATPGGSLTVELAPDETIVNASSSDNGLLDGEGASTRRGIAIATDSSPTADRNLQMAKQANFLFLKPLAPLLPQPVTLLTKREDGRMRRYTFQLETRDGPMTASNGDAFYAVRFSYPEDEAAAMRAKWEADREARGARRHGERDWRGDRRDGEGGWRHSARSGQDGSGDATGLT